MKRLTILALAALFVLGSVLSAAAAEIEATGDFRFQWVWSDNLDFQDSDQSFTGGAYTNEDDFHASQRFRCQIDITQSENLRGTVMLEIGTWQWGTNGAGISGNEGFIDTNGMIEVRRVFIDFNVPETDLQIRVGKFGLGLPSAVAGSPVMDGVSVEGIMATYPVNDMFAIAFVWARPADLDAETPRGGVDTDRADEMDVFGLVVPITLDYFTFQPYVLYASIAKDVQDAYNNDSESLSATTENSDFDFTANHIGDGEFTNAWWFGFALDVDYFDPLTFGLDFAYGTVHGLEEDCGRDGWYLAGRVDYRLDFMTPALVAWYASGNNDDVTDGSEQLPHIDGSFAGTTIAFEASSLLDADANLRASAEGTWGIALLLQDITFIEDLTHTFRIAYVHGTDENGTMAVNDVSGLADNEWAWEIDLNTTYMIYENLSLVCEMGWATLELDNDRMLGNDDTSDAWKIGFGLQYQF